jgi:hypothetical protein
VAPGKQDEFSRFTVTVLTLSLIDPPEKAEKGKTTDDADGADVSSSLETAAVREHALMKRVNQIDKELGGVANIAQTAHATAVAFFGPGAPSDEKVPLPKGATVSTPEEWVRAIESFAEQTSFTEDDVVEIRKLLRGADVVYDEITKTRTKAFNRLDKPAQSRTAIQHAKEERQRQESEKRQVIPGQDVETPKPQNELGRDQQSARAADDLDQQLAEIAKTDRNLDRFLGDLDKSEEPFRDAIEKAIVALNKYAVKLANADEESDTPAIPDAFDRPGTLPFGNPLPGIEFQPLVPIP